MARYKVEKEVCDGWSRWINPKPVYQMACCDCGLVHTLEFRIIVDDSKDLDPENVTKDKSLRIIFRAKRNNRATGQVRRKKKK